MFVCLPQDFLPHTSKKKEKESESQKEAPGCPVGQHKPGVPQKALESGGAGQLESIPMRY